MQHKFAEFHDAKRIRSISLLSFSRKKKNWSPFKKISPKEPKSINIMYALNSRLWMSFPDIYQSNPQNSKVDDWTCCSETESYDRTKTHERHNLIPGNLSHEKFHQMLNDLCAHALFCTLTGRLTFWYRFTLSKFFLNLFFALSVLNWIWRSFSSNISSLRSSCPTSKSPTVLNRTNGKLMSHQF